MLTTGAIVAPSTHSPGLFPEGLFPRTSVILAASFLEALEFHLVTCLPLIQAMGGPVRVFQSWPGAKVTPPFLVIEDYRELEPGEVMDSTPYSVTFSVYGLALSEVRRIGRALQEGLDSPNQNPSSTRSQLAWSGGSEESCWRQTSAPILRLGKTDYGQNLFAWEIPYDFTFNLTL